MQESLFVSSGQQCKQRDVAVVIELSDSSHGEHAKNFIQSVKGKLTPSLRCTRLSIIFSSIKAQAVLNLRCDYKRCYKNGLDAVDRLLRNAKRTTRPYDKRTLANSIRIATDRLYLKQYGAREKAEKILVLILTSPPKKNAEATSEIVKDFHDRRIKIIAVGVGAGKSENLDEIVVFNHLKMQFDSFEDLVEVGASRIDNSIKDKVPLVFASRGGVPGLAGPAGIAEIDKERLAKLVEDQKGSCKNIVDIAFIMDSSGSVRKHYLDEKFFVQRIASKFEIIEAGSHGGVILFSSHGYVKTVIKFTDFLDTKSFNDAIGLLPFYGYMTRIDTALKLAHTELYTSEGRTRPNVKKLLFLITDGRQNPDFENGIRLDPAKEAEKLHLGGIQVYAVGVGTKVNETELQLITKDKKKVYMASDFKELISDAFVSKVSKKLCEGAAEVATTATTIMTRPAELKKPCNKSTDCGCCCCEKKPPVYINIFKGANNNNYLMQGATVNQNGNSNRLDSIGFRDIRPALHANNATRLNDMSSSEIANLIKQLSPYHEQMNASVKELLKRAMKEAKKRKRRDIPQ
eukprot:gene5460-6143_t